MNSVQNLTYCVGGGVHHPNTILSITALLECQAELSLFVTYVSIVSMGWVHIRQRVGSMSYICLT